MALPSPLPSPSASSAFHRGPCSISRRLLALEVFSGLAWSSPPSWPWVAGWQSWQPYSCHGLGGGGVGHHHRLHGSSFMINGVVRSSISPPPPTPFPGVLVVGGSRLRALRSAGEAPLSFSPLSSRFVGGEGGDFFPSSFSALLPPFLRRVLKDSDVGERHPEQHLASSFDLCI